jgi:hypothetical protein
MRKTKTGLTIIILLIIVLLLKYYNKKSPNINRTSVTISEVAVPAYEKANEQKIAKINDDTLPIENGLAHDLPYIDPELSFLSAFRDYTFFALCAVIVTDLEQNINPLDSFRIKAEEKNKMFGYSGGVDHESYFLEHVENCKGYLIKDNESFASAYTRLKTIYQNIEPKTEEEIELAKNITLFENIENQKKLLADARKGLSSITPKAREQLHLKLENLTNIIAPLLSLSESDRTIEHANQITYYQDKRRVLADKLRGSNLKDDELIKYLAIELNNTEKLLTENFISIKSSDIYALMTRWYPNQIADDYYANHNRTISEHSKDKTPFRDIYYPVLLIRPALTLFACALEYPCTEDSQITLYHCIYMYNKNACGRDVEDFYLNHYVSPNMQQDLNIFLNFLFDYYAKD